MTAHDPQSNLGPSIGGGGGGLDLGFLIENAGRIALVLLSRFIPGLGDIITDPAFGFLVNDEISKQDEAEIESFLQNIEASNQTLDSALAAVSEQIPGFLETVQEVREASNAFYGEEATTKRFGDALGPTLDNLQSLQPASAEGFASLVEGFSGREDKLISMLEGFGDQERKDINRRFDLIGSNAQAGLQARGLSTSTIAPSIAQSNAAEKSNTLSKFEERLQGQKIDLATLLSGDTLSAQKAGITEASDIGLAVAGETGRIGQAGFNAGSDAFGTLISNELNFAAAPLDAAKGFLDDSLSVARTRTLAPSSRLGINRNVKRNVLAGQNATTGF